MASSSKDGSRAEGLEEIAATLGGLAHDLNNVFAVVASNVTFARREIPDEHPSQEDLSDIAEVTERGIGIVDNLRAMAGRLALRPQRLSLEDVVGGLGDDLSVALDGCEVAIEVGPGLPEVEADRARLERAVVDIASAVRATFGGRARVRIGAIPCERPPGAGVLLSFGGIGDRLGGDRARDLLRPYCTADNYKITGLEVAAARGFVAQSGGEMGIGEGTGGTAVELWLPAAE